MCICKFFQSLSEISLVITFPNKTEICFRIQETQEQDYKHELSI